MQHFSTDQVKNALFSTINSLSECREDFLVNPLSDFTRTKKISFEQTMLFPMIAGSDNIATELLDFFGEETFRGFDRKPENWLYSLWIYLIIYCKLFLAKLLSK